MEDNTQEQAISFAAFEKTMLRHERTNKRLFTAVIALLLLCVASNATWLFYYFLS